MTLKLLEDRTLFRQLYPRLQATYRMAISSVVLSESSPDWWCWPVDLSSTSNSFLFPHFEIGENVGSSSVQETVSRVKSNIILASQHNRAYEIYGYRIKKPFQDLAPKWNPDLWCGVSVSHSTLSRVVQVVLLNAKTCPKFSYYQNEQFSHF